MHSQIFQPSAAPMLYTWHFRKLFAIFTTLKTTFRIAKNLLHPFLKVDIYVHCTERLQNILLLHSFKFVKYKEAFIYISQWTQILSDMYLIWIFRSSKYFKKIPSLIHLKTIFFSRLYKREEKSKLDTYQKEFESIVRCR